MQVREYRPSDLEALKRFHANAGYDFEFPELDKEKAPLLEVVEVVEDANGKAMMAGVAKKTLELFLLCNHAEHPVVRMQGIAMLHYSMAPQLKEKGYEEANAFIPPELNRYANRLCKQLGWAANWPTFTIKG